MTLMANPVNEPESDSGRGGMADSQGIAVDGGMPMPAAVDWTEHAMCVGKTELFFARPGEREGRRNRREAMARSYCACCTVAATCKLAGRLGREHGVWGGENDEERAAAGFSPRSPHRRAVAAAAREARVNGGTDLTEVSVGLRDLRPSDAERA